MCYDCCSSVNNVLFYCCKVCCSVSVLLRTRQKVMPRHRRIRLAIGPCFPKATGILAHMLPSSIAAALITSSSVVKNSVPGPAVNEENAIYLSRGTSQHGHETPGDAMPVQLERPWHTTGARCCELMLVHAEHTAAYARLHMLWLHSTSPLDVYTGGLPLAGFRLNSGI